MKNSVLASFIINTSIIYILSPPLVKRVDIRILKSETKMRIIMLLLVMKENIGVYRGIFIYTRYCGWYDGPNPNLNQFSPWTIY